MFKSLKHNSFRQNVVFRCMKGSYNLHVFAALFLTDFLVVIEPMRREQISSNLPEENISQFWLLAFFFYKNQ